MISDLEGFPWCYTMDPDTRWESCGIPRCDEPARNSKQDIKQYKYVDKEL